MSIRQATASPLTLSSITLLIFGSPWIGRFLQRALACSSTEQKDPDLE